jgi:hypothetical protein
MPPSFLHERKDFKPLLEAVAAKEKINDPSLVEKDYWIMHAVYGLKKQGFDFDLKGGTSLSKGFGVIHRFSEDIDILIRPFDGLDVATGPNQNSGAQIESRRVFFETLAERIKIPGIIAVERDLQYDDERLRNAGLRLRYDSNFGAVAGLKEGILLEAGFDQTDPNTAVAISSWAHDFASAQKLDVVDNRAKDVRCYNPEYTFVEKLQTVVKKFGQFKESGVMATNFLRHYYDIHQLLDVKAVQDFIGTDAYLEHKRKRFRSLNQNCAESGAFTPNNADREGLEVAYKKTEALYYRGQIPFEKILARIQTDLARL